MSHYGKKDREFRNGIEERRVKAVIEFDYLSVSLTRLRLSSERQRQLQQNRKQMHRKFKRVSACKEVQVQMKCIELCFC